MEYTRTCRHRVFTDYFGKPCRKPSDDTFARWIKTELVNAGIDISVFKAHSCRSASSSKAKNIGIPFSEILKWGCWSSQNTFTRFYVKDIINTDIKEDFNFSTPILQAYVENQSQQVC